MSSYKSGNVDEEFIKDVLDTIVKEQFKQKEHKFQLQNEKISLFWNFFFKNNEKISENHYHGIY